MFKTCFLVLCTLALARAQMPALGWCPDYVPMTNFDMSKFLGTWYEAERSFLISEVASRCAMANYTQGPDNKYRVSNEITNRFTGVKRVLEGEIKAPPTKAEAAKLFVRYTTVPLDPETSYAVLDTDYTKYAVMWSCSNLGLVSAQSAWIMTRDRLPPGEVLQKAYGILDKYKISKTFFVKADQENCDYSAATTKPDAVPQVQEAETPVEEVLEGNSRSADISLDPNQPTKSSIAELKAEEKEEIILDEKSDEKNESEVVIKAVESEKEEKPEEISLVGSMKTAAVIAAPNLPEVVPQVAAADEKTPEIEKKN